MPEEDFEKFKTGIARIYNAKGIGVGVGFLVYKCYLLTCAHVVESVLGNSQSSSDKPCGKIELDFPLVTTNLKIKAEVVVWIPKGFSSTNEDIAVLKLLETAPQGVHPMQLQPINDPQQAHPCKIFGFPIGHPHGLWVSAVTKGVVTNQWVQLEDEKSQGYPIMPGYSGAPVWDETIRGVIGMVVARDKQLPQAKVGFMISKKSLLPALRSLDVYELLELLEPLADQSWQIIDQAYRICCPEIWSCEFPQSIREIGEKLKGITDENQSASNTVHDFVACLVVSDIPHDLQQNLKQWLSIKSENPLGLLDWAKSKLQNQQFADSAKIQHPLAEQQKQTVVQSDSITRQKQSYWQIWLWIGIVLVGIIGDNVSDFILPYLMPKQEKPSSSHILPTPDKSKPLPKSHLLSDKEINYGQLRNLLHAQK